MRWESNYIKKKSVVNLSCVYVCVFSEGEGDERERDYANKIEENVNFTLYFIVIDKNKLYLNCTF